MDAQVSATAFCQRWETANAPTSPRGITRQNTHCCQKKPLVQAEWHWQYSACTGSNCFLQGVVVLLQQEPRKLYQLSHTHSRDISSTECTGWTSRAQLVQEVAPIVLGLGVCTFYFFQHSFWLLILIRLFWGCWWWAAEHIDGNKHSHSESCVKSHSSAQITKFPLYYLIKQYAIYST